MTVFTDDGLLGAGFLGLLQGLTEFLPVSSSGHLVLFQQFVDIGEHAVFFDLVLHVGTLIPVLWFYRDDLRRVVMDLFGGQGDLLSRQGVRLAALVAVATVPTGVIGLLFEDTFDALFGRPEWLTVTFAVTGAVLYATRGRDSGVRGLGQVGWGTALALGVAQGLAITPGISRSGSTIAVALLLGVNRELAARLSFLMSVPAIAGAVLLKSRDVAVEGLHIAQLVVGGFTALLVGYLALVLLVRLVKRGRFSYFAWYCWFMAVVSCVLAWTHPLG